MGLQDREYMRRGSRLSTPFRPNWRTWLFAAGSVIAVASAAVWLLRDVRYLVSEPRPAKGSLIVNINTGTQAELETVPGIGPTRAAQIIAGRPYRSVDELIRIAGIGSTTLNDMRPFVTVDVETRER
jgi:hypothetical protein